MQTSGVYASLGEQEVDNTYQGLSTTKNPYFKPNTSGTHRSHTDGNSTKLEDDNEYDYPQLASAIAVQSKIIDGISQREVMILSESDKKCMMVINCTKTALRITVFAIIIFMIVAMVIVLIVTAVLRQ